MTSGDTPEAVQGAAPRDAPRGRRAGFSIQSKLLVMLLGVTVVTAGVVGVVGYLSATASLKDAALHQLQALRATRASEIERTFQNIETAAVLESANESAVGASLAFNAAFDQLSTATLSDAQRSALDAFYRDSFIPDLEKRAGSDYSAAAFTPTSSAEAYLQALYTAPFDSDFDKSFATVDAGDGSAWSAASAKYHDYFAAQITQLGYDDALLLNTKGDVVYSAYKGVDLGTSLETGPYRDSLLTDAYQSVLKSNTLDTVVITDYERYLPSLGVPTIWVVSPVGTPAAITGALAFQVPSSTINDVMTGKGAWTAQGLGKTGETYLAGPDELLRSNPRLLLEHPAQYQKAVISAGTPVATAKREVQVKGGVLLQPVHTSSVQAALRGKTGSSVDSISYLGTPNITTYAPLRIAGLDWVIVARIDSSEAFAPAADFTRNLALWTALVVLLVCAVSLLLAQVFLRPLRRLLDGVRRVSAGQLGTQVDTRSRDEIAQVGSAFNDMSRSLQVKADLLDAEQAENERLLLTLMPEAVAKRYKQGEETIAEDHQDVTVLFADLLEFDRYSREVGSAEALTALNQLVTGFDDAASRLGVDRLRTTRRDGYLASCGSIVPRVDSARRVVELAVEMQNIVAEFNARTGTRLQLRAGVDTGTVSSGLIGRSSVLYDMWGDAVNLAHSLQESATTPGIFLTQRVLDTLPEMFSLSDAGSVETSSGPQRVWKVESEAVRA